MKCWSVGSCLLLVVPPELLVLVLLLEVNSESRSASVVLLTDVPSAVA